MTRWTVLAVLACWGLVPIYCAPEAASKADPNASVRLSLQTELEDFTASGWNRQPALGLPAPGSASVFVPEAGPAVEEYRRHLTQVAGSWGTRPVWHQLGKLPVTLSGGRVESLGVNVFRPEGESKGTLMFVHGYMSHAANFAYTFAWFVAKGWTVTTLDLPGHGLSTGERSDIAEFSDYGRAVQTWLEWTFAQGWPGERVLLAHSLGTAACLEALRGNSTPRPDKVVFCAPLLRPDWFPALQVGEAALGWAFRDFPSSFGWDGYLDGYVMPTHWFRALSQWLNTLEKQRPLDLPLTIYSGNRDTVVDESANHALYGRLVPRAPWIWLIGKGHLFLTGGEDREAFHSRLDALLGGNGE